MKKILVCNQKGGVGKSLIADELAFSFERTNTPMSFLDLDSQGGTIHQTTMRDDAEVAVIDTPGALQSQMGDWCADADVIIIPTRTTSRDIEPLRRMIRILQARAEFTDVLVVMNGWNRWRAASDFREWFSGESQVDNLRVATLVQSELLVQASAAGKSIIEYAPKSQAAEDIKDITEWARAFAGLKSEFRDDVELL